MSGFIESVTRLVMARIIFTESEESLLQKAQQVIDMQERGMFKPDASLLVVAECINNARVEYLSLNLQGNSTSSFTEMVMPRIVKCGGANENVREYYDAFSKWFDENYWRVQQIFMDDLTESEVDFEKMAERRNATLARLRLQKQIAEYNETHGSPPTTVLLDQEVHMTFASAGFYKNNFFKEVNIVPASNIDGGVSWKFLPER